MIQGGENAIPFHTQHDAALGEDNSTLLLKSCLGWVHAQFYIGRKGLQDIMCNSDFQRILQLHREMEIYGHPDVVPGYIFELASYTGQSCLMVPYVYICGTCPRRFLRSAVGVLGYGRDLPGKIKELSKSSNLESAWSEPQSTLLVGGKNGAASMDGSGHQARVGSDTLETIVIEQVAYISDITSMHCVIESVNELGKMPHAEQLSRQMEYFYVCQHCKRSAETISLPSNPGPFHADDCPRYMHASRTPQ
jgi:DNA-directed RNA polymerase subunit RPC12/RpoP